MSISGMALTFELTFQYSDLAFLNHTESDPGASVWHVARSITE